MFRQARSLIFNIYCWCRNSKLFDLWIGCKVGFFPHLRGKTIHKVPDCKTDFQMSSREIIKVWCISVAALTSALFPNQDSWPWSTEKKGKYIQRIKCWRFQQENWTCLRYAGWKLFKKANPPHKTAQLIRTTARAKTSLFISHCWQFRRTQQSNHHSAQAWVVIYSLAHQEQSLNQEKPFLEKSYSYYLECGRIKGICSRFSIIPTEKRCNLFLEFMT